MPIGNISGFTLVKLMLSWSMASRMNCEKFFHSYLNVKSENLFEIQKPIGVNAIGVDNLPNHANKSDILTKNDLARLANIETLPKKAQIKKFIESSEIEKITSLAKENEKVILNHKKVKEYLDKNDLESAVLTLFSI